MNHSAAKDKNDKSSKIGRKPKRDSTVIPTFTTERQSSGNLEKQGPHVHDLLQRECLCGRHTGAGSEGEEVQQKHEGSAQDSHGRASGAEGTFQASPGVESGTQQLQEDGQALPDEEREFVNSRMGHDFSNVRVHSDANAIQASRDIQVQAFTVPSVMRDGETPSNLTRLDEMLNSFNVPEDDVIALLGTLSTTEKTSVLSGGYQSRIASALDIGEMVRAVTNLDPDLAVQLRWVEAAASYRSQIGYSQISALVTGAGQPERDALKNARWRGFFVDVCTNETMKQAVVDLGFDLPTQLRWVHAELGNVTAELAYSDIQPLIAAAPQTERDLLMTPAWRDWLIQVTTNETMALLVAALGLPLKTQIQWMIAEGTSYTQVKTRIMAADARAKSTALGDQSFLREIKAAFSWDEFAKCVELLGRLPPTGDTMKVDPVVGAGLLTAWTASNPTVTIWPVANPASPGSACNPPAGHVPPANVHEEGGFIYQNIITGALSVRAVAAGGQASLPLNNPPEVDDSIVVGGYHTHPNVGPCWGAPFFSDEDRAWSSTNGVPILMRGAHPTVDNASNHATGTARLHLAGNRGFPGSAGGIAPQATVDGDHDEL